MLKNIFSNWSNIILSAISVFLLYPYFTKVLGEQQYGVWLLISSVTGYFGLLQLGVPLANVRYVSKYYAQNDIKKVSEVLSSNILFFSIVASVVMLLGTIISFLMDYFFIIPPELKTIAQIATILASLDIACKFVFEVFEGVVHGLQKFVLLNAVKNIGIILRVGLTYLLITHQNGIIKLSLILLVISVIQGIVFFIVTRKLIPTLKLSRSLLNKEIFKDVAKYSIYVLVLQAGARLSFQTDAIVIGSFISVGAIIWFSIANNILTYLMQFIVGISQALMPKVSSLDATGDYSSLTKTYVEYSKITFILLLPICYGLFIFGGDFIALWMGEKYRQVSGTILSILTVSYLFFLVQRGVAFPILMGTSKMKFLSILMVSTAILNLLLSIVLSSYYGLYGVAFGTAIPNVINVIAIVWYMCRQYKINLFEYVRKCLVYPVLASLPCLGTMILTSIYVDVSTYIHIVLAGFAGVTVYFICIKYIYFKNGIRSALQFSK
jgi:O-antigen/teichoic acid export membrane protein